MAAAYRVQSPPILSLTPQVPVVATRHQSTPHLFLSSHVHIRTLTTGLGSRETVVSVSLPDECDLVIAPDCMVCDSLSVIGGN